MSTYRLSTQDLPQRELEIHSLDAVQPMRWLREGWSDYTARPVWSTLYGLAVAGFCGGLAYLAAGSSQFYLVPFLFSGFLIITPMLSIGLIATARKNEVRLPRSGGAVRDALGRNAPSLAMMGLFLLLIFLNWIMISNLVYGGVFHEVLPTYEGVEPLPVMFSESLPFLLIYGGIALLLATLVFRIVALSIPMMVDEKVDAFNAAFASWQAVGENWKPMSLWALIIAGLCTAGVLTYFIGLVAVIPVLGYASWHAYRDTMTPLK